jgi:hypothetical protein
MDAPGLLESAAIGPEILRLLRDRDAAPRPPGADAHVAALLRAHVLRAVSGALSAAALSALLVKGAALAIDTYPDPAARPMQDVDLLVRRAECDAVVAALVRAGATRHTPPGRAYSAALLGEIQLVLPAGATSTLVEVHTSLDKLVARPVGEAALFARARPAPGLPGLHVPAPEDHALLVALHAAGHGLRHPIAFLDLEMLLRRGLDMDALVARARAWRLGTVMYAMLSAMRDLGAASVTDDLVRAFDPGPLRRAALRGIGGGDDERLGLRWVLRQTPLRDDPGAWALGLARYAAARARDGLAPPAAPLHDAPVTSPDAAASGSPSFHVPRWVRALLLIDRIALRVENLRDGLRDELLLAWIRPEDRASLTAALYADLPTYLPGGHRFECGLFAWEKRVIESPGFPRSGRVLVGAAGAGREVAALADRGYEIVAFDPCGPFVEAARGVGPPGRVTVVQAAYADLHLAASGTGPLAGPCGGPPFDAVVLGWGSLSHVMPAAERAALLRALRSLAPRAPVLASFALEPEIARPVQGKGRVRDGLRRLFGALGAPGASELGDHFFPTTGFFSYLEHEELLKLAWDAGYEVALFEETPYAHALLVPLAGAPS